MTSQEIKKITEYIRTLFTLFKQTWCGWTHAIPSQCMSTPQPADETQVE